MSREVTVITAGPLTTVQDRGRFGHRDRGVSPSGAADLGSAAHANRLAGNPASAAVLEATLGHLVLRASGALVIAVTGATCPGVRMDEPVDLAAGATLALGAARAGARAYVAIRGGVAVPPVLGSRSTDILGGLGPAPLRDGDTLQVGADPATMPAPGQHLPPEPLPAPGSAARLELLRGPRDDRLSRHGWEGLESQEWSVTPRSSRVAVRLAGAALTVVGAAVDPEPLVRGAIQVPPDGHPIVFLADHPVTGGYPVVGVLTAASCDLLAQCRPGCAVSLSSV